MSVLESLKSYQPPDELFHYTNQDGLLGILKSNLIRTTKVLCLNDSSEYVLALKLAREILETLSEDDNYSLEKIKTLRIELDVIKSFNIFVSSFTTEDDLLSQWRAYSNSSGGYSIGFSGNELLTEAKNQDFFLAECIYDPKKQREIITEFLQDRLSEDDNTNNEINQKYQTAQSNHLQTKSIWKDLASIAPILKDQGFKEEKEWRIITEHPRASYELSFREGQSYIIPYFNFSIENPKKLIKSIRIGPTPHPDISEDTLQLFLYKQNLSKTIIKRTSIPYRNW